MAISAYVLHKWKQAVINGATYNQPDLGTVAVLNWEDVAATPASNLPCGPNIVVAGVTVADQAALTALGTQPGVIVLGRDIDLDTVIPEANRSAFGTRMQAAGIPAAKVLQLVPAGATYRQAIDALRPYARNLPKGP